MNLTAPLIIAVDDEADDIFFLKQAIRKTEFSHRFQPFSNAEAAKNALVTLARGDEAVRDFPLVCFLDIKMGGMTGFDLLKWIRSEKGLDALPVLMYSSSDHPEDVDNAREWGAQGYLKKYPSVVAMQTVLDEAKAFAATVPPKKTFLQWNYRFVDSRDAVAAR